MMRLRERLRLAGLISASLLAGCAGTPIRQDFPAAPLPVAAAGDQWRYRVTDGFTKQERGMLQLEVVESRPDGLIVLVGDGEKPAGVRVRYSREWNPASGRIPPGLPLEPFTHGIASGQPVAYTPVFPALRFPLEPGQRWSERILATDPETQKSVAIRVRARVVGMETVRVPAGEFEAIRVQREAFHEDAEWWRSPIRTLEIDWYAPQLNQVVRRYLESEFWDYSSGGGGNGGGAVLRYGDRFLVELESFGRPSVKRD
jgi:hypothetical protein